VRTAEAHAGASDEGANGNGVAASAARRPYAASGGADDPKVKTPAARRARMAQAAVRTEANGSNDGARYEGSGDNEAKASAALRAYASAASNPDKAAAVAARRTSLAAVNDNEVPRAGCRHPTTATTVADAANIDDDEVTNGGRRRPKTVTAAAGVDDDEVDGRRTTPASTTTMSRAASATARS
jgi:hypothetical protein